MRRPRDFGLSDEPSVPPAPSRMFVGASFDVDAAAEGVLFDSEIGFLGVADPFGLEEDDPVVPDTP